MYINIYKVYTLYINIKCFTFLYNTPINNIIIGLQVAVVACRLSTSIVSQFAANIDTNSDIGKYRYIYEYYPLIIQLRDSCEQKYRSKWK